MDQLGRLRSLQGLTLLILVITLAITVAARFDHAPPPVAPTLDPAIARTIGQLSSRVATLEASAGRGARVDASFDRRATCRITNDRGGLAVELRDGAGTRRIDLSQAPTGARVAIAKDLGPPGEHHGLLLVQALVRTDNGIREKESHPHRLALACTDRAGREQQLDLAGCYFLAASQPQDLLLKTASNTCAFVVSDGSQLELVLDPPTLRSYLTEGGLFEVELRLGPLVVFDGPVTR